MHMRKHWTIFALEQQRVELVSHSNERVKDHHVNVLFIQVTLLSALTIFTLILFEITRYMTPVMLSEIIVDGGKMVIDKIKKKKKKKNLSRLSHS
jgi:hypothetical protein